MIHKGESADVPGLSGMVWFRKTGYFLISFVVALHVASFVLATQSTHALPYSPSSRVIYIASHARQVYPVAILRCPTGALHSRHQVRPSTRPIPSRKMHMERRSHARARHRHCQRWARPQSAR